MWNFKLSFFAVLSHSVLKKVRTDDRAGDLFPRGGGRVWRGAGMDCYSWEQQTVLLLHRLTTSFIPSSVQ